MMTRDADIRRPLHQWLIREHQNDPDAVVLQEVKIPRPSARIDMAAINGQLCGYEIKSDVDSLVRLRHQVKSFNVIFDNVSIVTTARHLKSAADLLPQWWGILLMEARGLVEERAPERNHLIDPVARLHMLDRAELYELGTRVGCPKIGARSTRAILIQSIILLASPDDVAFHVRSLLKGRAGRGQNQSSESSSSVSSGPVTASCL